MYLPYIMISIVYGLRIFMRRFMPGSLKGRQLLVFLLGMYSLILLFGCATGYARWVAFLRDGLSVQAQVIWNGTCTDTIYMEGRYRRAYKRILTVPASSFDPATQPFTDDMGGGSLIYRIQTATAKASVGAIIDGALAGMNDAQGALRLSNNALMQQAQDMNLPAVRERDVQALTAAQQAAAAAAGEPEVPLGFSCIGYRFFVAPDDLWVYAQEGGVAANGEVVAVCYDPRHLEENWQEKTIPHIMESSISSAMFFIAVLAETLFSGYWLGIRKKRNLA